MNDKRGIPSVDQLLQALGPQIVPRRLAVALIRDFLEEVRRREAVPDEDSLLGELRTILHLAKSSRLQPVINATGVVIHTNLGRSPLSNTAVRNVMEIASEYANLEMDLESGQRGHRAAYLEKLLALLCESQGATMVNNCAAALVLILRVFTREKPEVILSRGELVQIGGGFRIPEILESSGARLREVGTTNRTTLDDYRKAVCDATGLILKVHQSNFQMTGFVEAPELPELAALSRETGIPVAMDLGSGAIISTDSIPGLRHEPTPAEVLRHGVDLVCFSGDKLFGGPQAGMIGGSSALISRLKNDPFFRAIRCDKLVLAALQSSIETCLEEPRAPALPTLQMLRASQEELRQRAEKILSELRGAAATLAVVSSRAQPGGGTLPGETIESVCLQIVPKKKKLGELARELRLGSPPIIGYISEESFLLDLRTVLPQQDSSLTHVLRVALEVRSRIPSPL